MCKIKIIYFIFNKHRLLFVSIDLEIDIRKLMYNQRRKEQRSEKLSRCVGRVF